MVCTLCGAHIVLGEIECYGRSCRAAVAAAAATATSTAALEPAYVCAQYHTAATCRVPGRQRSLYNNCAGVRNYFQHSNITSEAVRQSQTANPNQRLSFSLQSTSGFDSRFTLPLSAKVHPNTHTHEHMHKCVYNILESRVSLCVCVFCIVRRRMPEKLFELTP